MPLRNLFLPGSFPPHGIFKVALQLFNVIRKYQFQFHDILFSVILLLSLNAAVHGSDSPLEMEKLFENTTEIAEILCSDMKNEALKIQSDSANNSAMTENVLAIIEIAEKCLHDAHALDILVPKVADILDEAIEDVEVGQENSSETLEEYLVRAHSFKTHLSPIFSKHFQDIGDKAQDIGALADSWESSDEIKQTAKSIALKAIVMKDILQVVGYNLDSNLKGIEENN